MNWTALVIMLISGGTMLWAVSKHRQGVAWAKPLAAVCAVIALLCAVLRTIGIDPAPGRYEREYQKISAQKLAVHLADRFPGARVLIITDPMRQTPAGVVAEAGPGTGDPFLAGLREGLGEKVTIVAEVVPEIPEDVRAAFTAESFPPGTLESESAPIEMILPPPEYWFTPQVFDKLVTEHAMDCDLIITTVGLPMDQRSMRFWRMKNRPRLAVSLGGMTPSLAELRMAIAEDAVPGFVAYSPDAVFDGKRPPKDLDDAFAKRYLLVTPDNVNDLAGKYPDLFPN